MSFGTNGQYLGRTLSSGVFGRILVDTSVCLGGSVLLYYQSLDETIKNKRISKY